MLCRGFVGFMFRNTRGGRRGGISGALAAVEGIVGAWDEESLLVRLIPDSK